MSASKKSGPGETSKDLSLKVVETLQALQLLRDAIMAVREGKSYHLPVLSGQLRSLLIDKSKNSERRLLKLAEELGVELKVYCMSGVDDPAWPLSERPTFWVSGFPIDAHRRLKNQREITLDAVLKEPFVLYEGIEYLGVFGDELPPIDRAKMLLLQEQRRGDPETKVMTYHPNSFGRAAPGERDLKMQGDVKLSYAKDLWPAK